MKIIWPVLATLLFVALDARTWLLAFRGGIEGVWTVMHLGAATLLAVMLWGGWLVDREETSRGEKRGSK